MKEFIRNHLYEILVVFIIGGAIVGGVVLTF